MLTTCSLLPAGESYVLCFNVPVILMLTKLDVLLTHRLYVPFVYFFHLMLFHRILTDSDHYSPIGCTHLFQCFFHLMLIQSDALLLHRTYVLYFESHFI